VLIVYYASRGRGLLGPCRISSAFAGQSLRGAGKGESETAMSAIPAASRRHLVGCAWFWAWTVVGAGGALAAVSLGPLLLVPAAALAALMFSRPSIRRSAYGLVSGAGVLLLYVAYVQRAGPGTTCWHTATSSGCDQHLNPIPWLVIGVACVVGGVLAHAKHSS
jgi:hypothetical protein